MAMLKTLAVQAFVDRSIFPGLFTLAILQIVNPLTFVLRAIDIEVGSKAVSLILIPLAVEYVAINVIKDTATVSLVV